ncbi:MAG: tRNA (adenosine(37)-N6)-threonylcarbamoyltransferase complex ATPase subunit type 1 TsaE [Bacteroidales bacterium]|nr:tRNA (adenosine(37)-N6)-threonylcarbamoyltransferase complex ATPase subunit type 1 TsaE [Bacteroidales bacterium]
MKHQIAVRDLSSIDAAAEEFLRLTAGEKLFAFHAPMGAGKTTFISALCRALGVREDAVGSPTFSIVNEYLAGDGSRLFHFDFYRINKLSEVLDIGFYDYIDSGAVCFMEWPGNIGELLPEEALDVFIEVLDDGSRIISWDR